MDNYDREALVANARFLKFTEDKPEFEIKRFTKEKYADYDVVYNQNGLKTIGEIKYRTCELYAFYYLYFEVEKYEKLKKIFDSSKSTKQMTYINHFNDNCSVIWKLNELDFSQIPITEELMQKNNYTTEKVLKKVYNLTKKMGTIYFEKTN